MDPREFLNFIWRHAVVILMVTVLTALLGASYTWRFDEGEKGGLIFLTMGMEIPDAIPAAYLVTSDGHNVVDHFTETVQGWLVNPALDTRIDELAGTDVQLAIRKQEKQNLLVTMTVPMEADVAQSKEAVLTVINQDIDIYNEVTNSDYVLVLSSISEFETPPQYALNMIVGGMLGVVFITLLMLFGDYILKSK
ncbi:hypothetical protein HN748_00265 [Candidatus Peregrinibacteria bacterium]|jgi:capsular polysaccharide biosynthesis protein|nr:hypothetical protein [Candidatus Peregrinibacteria bacterium]MBT7484614.1 hypothetical protein [Candidatus Peregrinibacteria bacterium]MBT7702646.1 hypothetical protein [Candidatus Peregrinibacteria bacterium]